MRVLVVDDEPPARARLVAMLADFPEVAAVSEAASGREALALVGTDAPDVLLLDIRMPGMDGIEVARHLLALDAPPAVIFTTAFDAHALEAFETRALDYLLKPVRQARLAEALARVRQRVRPGAEAGLRAQLDALEAAGAAPQRRSHLSAQAGASLRVVPVDEIRYLRADRKYVEAGYPGGLLLLLEPLVRLEAELGEAFLRVHRNALVSLRHVVGLGRNDRQRHVVELDGVDQTIEVSRRLLATVRARIQALSAPGGGRTPPGEDG